MNPAQSYLTQQILDRAGDDLLKITPSLQVRVINKGRVSAHAQFGEQHNFYDLASLTKILFTASSFMYLESQLKEDLSHRPVQDFFPQWPFKEYLIKDYLSHSAKMPAWRPFYRILRQQKQRDISAWLYKKLARIQLSAKNQYVYSDLDFWLCGILLEKISGSPLQNLLKVNPLFSGTQLHFSPRNRAPFAAKEYAPTEKCPWRKKMLRGQVHDDNCWTFGGVAGHAGLFGNMEDVATWGKRIREVYLGRSKYGLSQEVLKKYLVGDKKNPHFSYGFMKPKNPLGGHRGVFTANSVGHTGFTGTSFWWDRSRDLQIVILSNRVSPTRRNRRFVGFRKDIHDIVISGIKKGSL